ncbi:MAG: ABC transporter substrate-binding protein [Deferrisomatales bacterium]
MVSRRTHAENRSLFAVLVAAWGALAFLGLGLPCAEAASWVDAVGRRVDVPDAPARIVSLVPSVTETLFALGLGEQVVGVTEFCTFPPGALAKPRVGSYAAPSLEAVAALTPELVFASADMTRPAAVARLESLGIPVYVVYPRSLAGTVQMLRDVGAVAGAPRAGQGLAQELESTVERVKAAVSGRERPGVLLCVMVQPLVVTGPGTLADDLITTAGGRNCVPPGPAGYPTWGPEAVLAADPDVIVVSPHPGQPDPGALFRKWPELRAVAQRRVVAVETDWVHRPGPRLSLGLEALARAIHGAEVLP